MLIIRKPRCMRNSDSIMHVYLDVAMRFIELSTVPTVTVEERYEILKNASDCLKKASKAGGFFSVRSMQAYLEAPKN